MNLNKIISRFNNKAVTLSSKAELILLLFFITAFFLNIAFGLKLRLLTIIILLFIAIIYFFSSFTEDKDSELSAINNFIQKLIGFASAYSCVSLLYILQNWPNGSFMLIAGISTLVICLLLIAFQKIGKEKSIRIKPVTILRVFVLLVILLITFFLKQIL